MSARLLRRAVASLPAPVRWRTRNAIALARWFGQRAAPHDRQVYGDSFWTLHEGGNWNGLAEVVRRCCQPRSLVDVGCGDGKLLRALRQQDPAMRLLGIDGSQGALQRAAAADVAVLHHDLSSMRGAGLSTLRARIAAFDVAVSLETAEHLPPWTGAAFVESLAQVRLVMFSAAQPGQGGTLHMNERPPAYWRRQFERRGFQVAPAADVLRAAMGSLDLPWWYAANVQLFERRS